jgi:hypothetical protein
MKPSGANVGDLVPASPAAMHVVPEAQPTVAMYSDAGGEETADHDVPPVDDRSTTAWLNESGEYCPPSAPTATHVAPLHPVTET